MRVAELLLAHGADPNARDGMGATPLARAVQQAPGPGTRNRVLILVRAGAEVNARDHAGRSIAALAVASGSWAARVRVWAIERNRFAVEGVEPIRLEVRGPVTDTLRHG